MSIKWQMLNIGMTFLIVVEMVFPFISECFFKVFNHLYQIIFPKDSTENIYCIRILYSIRPVCRRYWFCTKLQQQLRFPLVMKNVWRYYYISSVYTAPLQVCLDIVLLVFLNNLTIFFKLTNNLLLDISWSTGLRFILSVYIFCNLNV